ncbi:MFS transporter [Desulfovibrio inopinatus]|uniref:MFS transporter n=1 Tax=Desulfovibrio inopinatus TaxID=102109 RepID=UPI0003F7C168|nr:MFS transporter [Desulfovibrio inopinatus]
MNKTLLFLLFIGHVAIDVSQGAFPVIAAKQKELFQLSYFQVGLMMTALNITSSVIQPAFGHIADRFRTQWFIPGGILWTMVAMGLLGWAPNYISAILLVGFAGLGSAAFHPTAMMAAFLASGAKRGFGAALFSTAGSLGYALGPMLGSFLVLGFGLHATSGLIPIGVVLFIALVFYQYHAARNDRPKKSHPSHTPQQSTAAIPWFSVSCVCCIVILRSWVYVSVITYLPLLLQTQNIQLEIGSIILTIFLTSGVVASLYGGYLSDRIGRPKVIICSLLLFTVFSSLMLMSKGPWLWILAGASGGALFASLSVTIVLTQELLPNNLGLASGLVLGLSFGIGASGTAITGFLADHFGLSTTFWILAFAPILAAGLVAFVKVPAKHRAK